MPTPPPTRRSAADLVPWLAAGVIFVSIAVFVIRGWRAWEATTIPPGLGVTSGFEEETHFALWRAAHGQTVYLDETRLPFASAYFNWLFYVGYSVPIRCLGISDNGTMIVRVSRWLTAGGAIAGALTLLGLLRRGDGSRDLATAAIVAFIFGGPLVGWWAHTARPDVWALAAETAGVAGLLYWHRVRPWRATLAALGLFFVAWSCKQTYVVGPAAGVLFLLWHGRRWQALVLALGTPLLWTATFLLLGADYRTAQQHTAVANDFYLGTGLYNLGNFLLKTVPLWLMVAGAFWITIRRVDRDHSVEACSRDRDIRRFGMLGLGLAFPLAFAASCKVGAAPNYYFTTALMLGLIAATLPRQYFTASAGFTLMGALQLLILAGAFGRLDLTAETQPLAQRWSVLRTLPEPRFSTDIRLNQPWLNPHSPPLVLAFNYEIHRRSGVALESGGVGELINQGYFAAMLVPERHGATLFGGKLDRYVPGETVAGMIVLRRKPVLGPP